MAVPADMPANIMCLSKLNPNSTIDTYLATFFNLLRVGISQKIRVDHLPGGIRYRFDVLVQCRFFISLVGNADVAALI